MVLDTPTVVAALAICPLLLFLGVVCLFWPDRIRDFALRTSSMGLGKTLNPFLSWMRTSQYLWSLRISSAVALGALIILLAALMKGTR